MSGKFFALLFLWLSGYIPSAMAICTGIGCSCSVSAPTLAFGAYDPNSNTDKTMNGTINVACQATLGTYIVSYSIALSTGAGTYTTRLLTNNGHTINYNLYTVADFSTVWGNGTGGTGTISDSYTSILSAETRPYTVYGMIPKLQNAFVGNPYTDSMTITVTY